MLSQASVDVTAATVGPLQRACALLDSFMALFLLAPLLLPALWMAVTRAMKRSGKSSGGSNGGSGSGSVIDGSDRDFGEPLLHDDEAGGAVGEQ